MLTALCAIDIIQVAVETVELAHLLSDLVKYCSEPYSDIDFIFLFRFYFTAPGGSIQEDADTAKVCRSEVCVFTTPDTYEDLTAYYGVCIKLLTWLETTACSWQACLLSGFPPSLETMNSPEI